MVLPPAGAPREETIGRASGAWADARDVTGRESRALELVADDGAQVDESFAGTPGADMVARAGNLSAEALAKLGVNLETTRANRGAHRGTDVRCAAAQLFHRADANAGNIRKNAAPSGVESAGYSSLRIGHQYRHAVGREYPQDETGFGGDDPVARRPQRRGLASRGMNDVAMHLVKARDQTQLRRLATDALPVGIDGAVVVADPIGKIHRGECAPADAARAADKAVTDRGVGPCAKDFDHAGVGR